MIVIVVVASLSDAISSLRLPDWTELRNSEAVLSLALLAPICSPYVLLRCSLVFVSRLCQKLRSESAIVVKGGKLT